MLIEFKYIKPGARFAIVEPDIARLKLARLDVKRREVTEGDPVLSNARALGAFSNTAHRLQFYEGTGGEMLAMVPGWFIVAVDGWDDIAEPAKHCKYCYRYCPTGTLENGLCIRCDERDFAPCDFCKHFYNADFHYIPTGTPARGYIMGTESPIEFEGHLCEQCRLELIDDIDIR